ncbi:uncharacterized protein TNCV_727961 [Trichonephila clavipes]|nr:uncharacterized protein TNCV_727961 [Trichonephila clavipes]
MLNRGILSAVKQNVTEISDQTWKHSMFKRLKWVDLICIWEGDIVSQAPLFVTNYRLYEYLTTKIYLWQRRAVVLVREPHKKAEDAGVPRLLKWLHSLVNFASQKSQQVNVFKLASIFTGVDLQAQVKFCSQIYVDPSIDDIFSIYLVLKEGRFVLGTFRSERMRVLYRSRQNDRLREMLVPVHIDITPPHTPLPVFRRIGERTMPYSWGACKQLRHLVGCVIRA